MTMRRSTLTIFYHIVFFRVISISDFQGQATYAMGQAAASMPIITRANPSLEWSEFCDQVRVVGKTTRP